MAFADWIGAKDEAWRRLADAQHVEAMDEDTGELVDIKPKQDDPNDVEGLLVRFGYTDASGKWSRRVVLCRSCWVDEDVLYIRGFCTIREALRTFRVDRMAELEEVRSGRKIGDPHDYFEIYADGHAPVRRRRQGASSWTSRLYLEFETLTEDQLAALAARKQLMHRVRHTCIDGLKVLAHIALIDGVATEEERNIELSYVESRLAMAGFDHNGEIVDAMADVAFALAVPPNSYSRSCNRVASDQAHFDLVLSIAITLAGIDGRIDEGESKALRRLLRAGIKKGRKVPC
jgi:tellurite resistance protein